MNCESEEGTDSLEQFTSDKRMTKKVENMIVFT